MWEFCGRLLTSNFAPHFSAGRHVECHTILSMPNSSALHHSQLIFPSAHTSISTTLTNLKRSNLTISNRINSIVQDASFVEKVASAYRLPVIANERCGSWYISPTLKAGSACFKSTDGHHGQWSFSLRRLNLHILDIIGQGGG